MSWQTTTLAGSMGGIEAKANDAVAQVQNNLNKLNVHVNQIKGRAHQDLTYQTFEGLAPVSSSTIVRRFGGWNKAREMAMEEGKA